MSAEEADRLQEELEQASWPPRRERPYHERLRAWIAFRESDGELLRPAGWDRDEAERRREYVCDPLPSRIAGVWADMLFAEEPEITAAREGDQGRLEALVEENQLPSELPRAERIVSSEGEVWWRVVSDPALTNARIEWHSRLSVVPRWRSGKALALAFVSKLESDEQHRHEVWRYVELHAQGLVRNLLYRGSRDRLGTREELSQRPETEGLKEEWPHGLEAMLAGRIVNALGYDYRLGASDYAGVVGLLEALNEATTIGVENARLTAKKRVVVPQRYLNQHGEFPAGADVIIGTEEEVDPSRPAPGLAQLEWSFDADALIAYVSDLTDRILTRVRVAPQLVGRHTEGAATGPALRARLLDSVLAAQGKGRFWDSELPRVLQAAALVESLPRERGGLGRQWSAPGELPTVTRRSILPEDEDLRSRRVALEVSAELLSRRTGIEESHPDWDEERVAEELRRMEAEASQNGAAPVGEEAELEEGPV